MNDSNGKERMAQLEKALLRSLESLERGDVDAARDELMRVAPAAQPEPLAPSLTDGELDAAFAAAEPEHENMLDANRVAQAAIAEADHALASETEQPRAHEVGDRFATATMASLLESQGDVAAASRIRAALGPETDSAPRAAGEGASRPSREHVIRELETWLGNIRGGARV